MNVTPRYCRTCRRRVLAVWSHSWFGPEAVIVVGTCGLYLPFWIWKMLRSGWSCPRCATRV